jgi:hypothetical protein
MNTTSRLDSATGDRKSAIRTIALPAAAAASILAVLGSGLSTAVLGGMNLGNHNETLLPGVVHAEPTARTRRLRRATVSALVVSASLAVGAVTFDAVTSPGGDHDAYPDTHPTAPPVRTQPAGAATGWDLKENKKI